MTTYTVRRPEDLIALAPVVLGFMPTASLTMLTFGEGPAFHARLDLPDPRSGEAGEECGEIPQLLLQPALAHGVRAVAFVFFAEHDVGRLARDLSRGFADAGIEVLDSLRFHRDRWFCATCRCRRTPSEGIELELSGHPLMAQAIFEGRVVLDSRERLRDLLAPDAAAQQAVAGWLSGVAPDDPVRVGRALRREVGRWVAEGHLPNDQEARGCSTLSPSPVSAKPPGVPSTVETPSAMCSGGRRSCVVPPPRRSPVRRPCSRWRRPTRATARWPGAPSTAARPAIPWPH